MTWKELLRRMHTAFDRHPDNLNDTAMCRTGDVLYELDLFRSLSLGRLHVGPAYPYHPNTEEDQDWSNGDEQPSLAPADAEDKEYKREIPVDVKPTSWSRPKHE